MTRSTSQRERDPIRAWLLAIGAIAVWFLLATNSAEAQQTQVPDIVLAQVLGHVPKKAPAKNSTESGAAARAPRPERIDLVALEMQQDFQDQLVAGVTRPSVELEVHFDWDSDRVHEESGSQIAAAAEVLNGHFPTTRFRVAGYADPTGEPEYNQMLSERRASAVWRVLVEEHGVDAERLERRGFGVDASDRVDSDAQRRRVELQILRGGGVGGGAGGGAGGGVGADGRRMLEDRTL